MELHFERPLMLEGVPELRTRIIREGGTYVVYLSCASLILFTSTRSKVVWIRPGEIRLCRGIVRSISSMLFGWWSLGGILRTMLVLAHNGLGGFDLTATIMDPRTEDGELHWEKTDAGRAFQSKRFSVFICMLVIGIVIIAPLLLSLLLDVIPRWLF